MSNDTNLIYFKTAKLNFDCLLHYFYCYSQNILKDIRNQTKIEFQKVLMRNVDLNAVG